MAPEPESAEVRRLLHATAPHPDGPPDLAAVHRGVRRRRRTRRGLGGVAALGAVAVLGLVVPDDDPSTRVHVANEPDTTVVEEPPVEPAEVEAPPVEPHPEDDAPAATADDVVRLDDLEAVSPESIGRDLLVFGDAGVDRIVDGERRRVWGGSVERAFGDGEGGAVFQYASDEQAIWHLPAGANTPGQLVGPEEHPELWSVAGREAWITTGDTSGMNPDDTEPQMLVAVDIETGSRRTIGQSGGYDTGLDGVAHLPEGRTLFSTCHIQCAVRRTLDDPEPIVLPHWLGGLDGGGDRWSYVRFDMPGADGRPTRPVLTVHDLADEVVAQVLLPEAIGWQTFVDLSADGSAALVWSQDWQTQAVTGPVLVEGLDTDAPRVRRVDAGGQAVRFS